MTTSSSRPSEVVAAGSAEVVICGPLPTSDNIEEEAGVALFGECGMVGGGHVRWGYKWANLDFSWLFLEKNNHFNC